MKTLKIAKLLAGLTAEELREVVAVARALPGSRLKGAEKVEKKPRKKRGPRKALGAVPISGDAGTPQE